MRTQKKKVPFGGELQLCGDLGVFRVEFSHLILEFLALLSQGFFRLCFFLFIRHKDFLKLIKHTGIIHKNKLYFKIHLLIDKIEVKKIK